MFVRFLVVVMVAVLVAMSLLIVLVMVRMFVAMSVFVLVMMLVLVSMMVVLVGMRVRVSRAIRMRVLMTLLMRDVNVELKTFDGGFVSAGNAQVVSFQVQLFQFVLQSVRIDTEIEQGTDKHVATDPAEDVQV